ncbi:MAG TPA: TonB-dependent receptor, partial [Mucilaginibacter sp.]
MKNIFLISILLIVFSTAFAQKKFTISGTITDKSTGETLIGATVRIKELPQNGTATNSYGFYSLSAPQGIYTLLITYIGYETVMRTDSLYQNHTVNMAIGQQNALNEVVISANRPNNDQIVSPQMGVEKLNMSQINNVPVLLGEKDILKTISLLPGIKAAGEGNTGFYVRGGASDQNLILLDEATVYNASHLLGFFSTFNSDAIKDVSIYKGGMPAEYGGRLSSVLDIKMNDGNSKDFTVQGGLGLISSRIKVEGPLGDKGSFMVSGRRTYLDLLLKASKDTTLSKSTLNFYDLNAKFNYHFNDKNAIYLSGYFGNDNLGIQNTFGTNWGNSTATIRYNHVFSNKLFSNTSLVYSNYGYTVQNFSTDNNFKSTSQITDLNLKEDFQFSLNDKHTLKFGFNVLHHNIAPGNITSTEISSINDKNVEQRYGFENAAYLSDSWKASPKLTFEYGLRLSNMML